MPTATAAEQLAQITWVTLSAHSKYLIEAAGGVAVEIERVDLKALPQRLIVVPSATKPGSEARALRTLQAHSPAFLAVVNRASLGDSLDLADYLEQAEQAGRRPNLAEIAAAAIQAQPQESKVVSLPSADAWPLPMIPGAIATPEIPATILPSWPGEMAGAVAEWTQTPPAMAVLITLSVLAAASQRRFEVSPYGADYREPLALWTLTALASGSRKSAVINELTSPCSKWEKLARDRVRSDLARNYAEREIAKKRIEKLLHDSGKAGTDEKRNLIQTEIERERSQMPQEMYSPRVFSGDITAERLQQLLVEQGESMSVFTDEGGLFGVLAGQYSGGQASLDVFLQSFSGTPMRVDRAGRMAHLDRPALSFGLAIQPGILADVGRNKRFRDSGLMARFLYAVPRSTVGTRDVRAHRLLDPSVRDAWDSNVRGLLDERLSPASGPRVLGFSSEAAEAWLDFSERIERMQGDGGRLEMIADWSAKLPGTAARISALLELAQGGIMSTQVRGDSARRAVQLCELLIPHAEAAFRLAGAADAESDAIAVLKWIMAQGHREFTRHLLHRSMEGRFRKVDRLLAALRVLQDWSIIGEERSRPNARARASAYYLVNPRLFVGTAT